MNRLLLSAASAAVALCLASTANANSLLFQMNPNFDTGGVRQLFLFGQSGASGTVTNGAGFSSSFTLGADGFAVINIPVGNELGNATIENKGFRVESSQAISGYYLSKRANSTDMTYLIDGDRLGTDHVVAGYHASFPDQLSVQASVDNTVVTIRPKNAAEFQVTLNAGQTYMYTANTNLSGSRVLSTAPVAVFSGNRCTNIPTNAGACDHIVEQIPSVDKLSSSYLLAQTPRTGSLGNVFRAIATQDATEVRLNGNLVATLAAGQYYEGRVAGGNELVATKPILVAQYLVGQSEAGANTDPAMTIVPGADQWLKSYVFATPSGAADFPTDFVSIIIRTADLGSLRLDGNAPNISNFNPLGSTAFSFGDIDVSLTSGAFSITADSPFQLLLSGFNDFDSYFTYGGAAFSPGASPPPPPPPPPLEGEFLNWDGNPATNFGNGTIDGGTGIWTATRSNFANDAGVNGVYNPQPGVVKFRGAPGTVTVDNSEGQLGVLGMNFLVSGYVIDGDPLELEGGTATITVGDGSAASADWNATISANLFGSAQLAKAGLGTLILSGANSYSGGTLVEAGTLVGGIGSFGTGTITNNAALVLDVPTDGVLPNLLAGTGSFTKNGAGILTLNGVNTATGPFAVNAGRLRVDGTLGSVVNVANGAVLMGTGTVGGFAIASGGRVAPGPGIGTLSSTGNVSIAGGGIYAVDVTSTGQSDRIVVTGNATLSPGAQIIVTKTDAPRYVLGTRYTVLTTTGALTGSFAVSGDTRVSTFINVVGATDARNAYLDVRQTRSFASAAGTPNQIAAATGVDNSGNGNLYTAIAYLQTDAEARAAFDQVSGEVHASARGATLHDSRFVREAISHHFLASGEPTSSVWAHAYGSWGRTQSDGNAARVQRDIGGFFIGGDILASDTVKLGVLAGYGAAEIKVPDRNSNVSTDDIHLAAYAGIKSGNLTATLALAHAWRNIDSRRTVSFTGFQDSLTASYQTRMFQAFAEAAYTIDAGPVGIEPFAQAAFVDISTAAFAETGGAARLTAGKTSDDFIVTTLGARVKAGLPMGNGSFGVVGEVGWRHTGNGNVNTPMGLGFGAGPVFTVAGPPIARDAAALGLTISGSIGANAEVEFGYSGQVGDGFNDHGVKAGFLLRF